MKKFEYKIVKEEDELTNENLRPSGSEGALNGYGSDGWELVSVTIENGSHGIGSKTRVYFFKRVKE
ncbi:MAG: DUF4177 domain-containing protein [Candidatus Paceibacterota bacterium]|jgi:hypothetical protein